jgi:hypothetical protein
MIENLDSSWTGHVQFWEFIHHTSGQANMYISVQEIWTVHTGPEKQTYNFLENGFDDFKRESQ